jgi:DNA-binding IclR family transcriptional regulator
LWLLREVARAQRSMSFAELLRVSDLPRSSAHNILTTLVEAGFLHRDEAGKYTVGLTAFEVGSAHPVRTELLRLAEPTLRRLVREHNETCHLGVLEGGDVLYVERLESTQNVRLTTATGARVPAYPTGIGKALLSRLTDDEVLARYPDGLQALTAKTIASPDALLAELRTIRERGYALDDEESTPGVRCAAAVADAPGWPSAGISMAMPLQRFPEERNEELGSVLAQAAEELRQRMAEVHPGFTIAV